MIAVSKYAEMRGVSHTAVQVAIKTGRLVKSVAKDAKGKWKIIDPAMADREWAEQTDQSKPRNSITGDPKRRKATAQAPYQPRTPAAHALDAAVPANEDVPPAGAIPSYAESRALREYHQARAAAVEADEAEGRVVSVDDVQAAWSKVIGEAKTRLLAVASKAKGRLPHLTPEDVVVLDDLMRDALGEMSKCPLPSKN